jgi:predicted dehydrogenase
MADLLKTYEPEVLVLATPPTVRQSAIEVCPGLKAVLCEKPLGVNAVDAWRTVEYCAVHGILMQVNTWRRCDPLSRRLAEGELRCLIGRPQIVRGVYGNGLLNNGTHLVDLLRMLFGEIVAVRPFGSVRQSRNLAMADDFDVACLLNFESGLISILQPVDFGSYREVGIDVWGDDGRLEILNEGLTNIVFRRVAHRALSGAHEIAIETAESIPATVGKALFHVYDNLAAALDHRTELLSSGTSAWRTAVVVEAIRNAALFGSDADQRVRYDRPLSDTVLSQ